MPFTVASTDRSPSAGRSLIGRLTAGGTTGNERLTTATGLVLLVLLAVIGVTILRLRPLLWIHLFVGMLLIGPIALKMASTGLPLRALLHRQPALPQQGPAAAPLLRMIAPIVVLSTIAVFVSGVALLLIGPSSRATLLPIHKVSFFVWVAFTSLHVLGHLPEVAAPSASARETASRSTCSRRALESQHLRMGDPGRHARPDAPDAGSRSPARWRAAPCSRSRIPQFGPWLHASSFFHHH